MYIYMRRKSRGCFSKHSFKLLQELKVMTYKGRIKNLEMLKMNIHRRSEKMGVWKSSVQCFLLLFNLFCLVYTIPNDLNTAARN